MRLYLDHIGVASRDAAPIVTLLESLLDLHVYKREEIEREGVRTHFLSAGGVKLEILEELVPDSSISRFLSKRGEGLHHLAFEVPDVLDYMDRVRSAGFSPLSAAPLPGADDKLIFFLHPKETHGILIEFCQDAERVQECVVVVYSALEPFRPIPLRNSYKTVPMALSTESIRTPSVTVRDMRGASAAHIVGIGPAAHAATRYAKEHSDSVKTLVLHNAPFSRMECDGPEAVLISATSHEAHMDLALELHRGIPGSQLAVLPAGADLDSALFARLLEHFFANVDHATHKL